MNRICEGTVEILRPTCIPPRCLRPAEHIVGMSGGDPLGSVSCRDPGRSQPVQLAVNVRRIGYCIAKGRPIEEIITPWATPIDICHICGANCHHGFLRLLVDAGDLPTYGRKRVVGDS